MDPINLIPVLGIVCFIVVMTVGDSMGNLLKLLGDPQERELIQICKQARSR